MKNLEKIKELLPEILHVVMFYDDGTVFQSTFESNVNIPKLGENLSEAKKHAKILLEVSQFKEETLKKVVYETNDLVWIILDIGEMSNLALIFKKGASEPDITPIRRHIRQIENLIDTDKKELAMQSLIEIDTRIFKLENELEESNKKNADLTRKLTNIEEEINAFSSELNNLMIEREKFPEDSTIKLKIETHESRLKTLELQKLDLSNELQILIKDAEGLLQEISEKVKEKNELHEQYQIEK